MEEDEETKRLNERRRQREERKKKQEEDDAKEELERKAREEERKLRKESRNKERGEREAQQKKELEEYIKRTEDERKQRREEREKRRLEEERLAKEDEEKRKKQQEEREKKRREEDEEKKKKLKELEESRKRVLKELEDDENNSQVESILSQKKKRLLARQKIESILSTIDPTNNQYSSTDPTTKIMSLLLTDELKDEIIDLVSSGFRSLIEYMSLPASLATMVEYLVDINVGASVFSAKIELSNGTASIELKNALARMQASYEILKGGIPILAKIITDPVNSFILDILFGMISNPPPISLTNMHIFTDLVCSFMSRKPDLLIYICNNKDSILPSLMQHLSNTETVDLLLKMAEVEMTQFSDSSSSSNSSSSAASSFFSLFTGSSSSSSSSSSPSSNNKEKTNWTNDLTPYLILRINEISNLENVIIDQLDLEIDNIQKLMFELVKKYPKSKVAHHLCGQSFSNSVLRNGFKLALVHPFTSPFSSSMLSLICTLIDSSITMTQLSSTSTTTPDLPSVVNLLFKQIVIVEEEDGNARELSPMKAISEILTIKKHNPDEPQEIFSIVRLKCLHLINSMIKANIARLDREIWESGILKKCIDIFFEYETNNVIHCIIEGFLTPLIQRCLGSDDEEFMCHLLKDCSFVSRVVNILSGGDSGSPVVIVNSNGNNSLSSASSGSSSLNSNSGSGVASKLSALFVNNSKDNDVVIVEQQKSEPVIGAPAPTMGSLSRGGGKKVRRKVSFFSDPNEEEENTNNNDSNNSNINNNSNGNSSNSNGGDVRFAIGDLSLFQAPTTNNNSNNSEQQSNINVIDNTVTDSEKKLSGSLSTLSSSSSSSPSTTSTLLKSTSSNSLLKKKEKELKEQEKLKQKEKEKELLEMLKSKQLTADQEKEIKAQRKQEKKERKQKREEKKLAKRLKEKENGKSKSTSLSSLKNGSGSISSSKLKTSSQSSSSSSPVLVSTTTTTIATTTTTTTTTNTTTTTLVPSPSSNNTIISDQSSDTSSNSDSCSNSDLSSDITKLSLVDNNNNTQIIDASIEESIESIEEQSIVVVYHNEETTSTTSLSSLPNIIDDNSDNNINSNNTECNNSNDNNNIIEEDISSASTITNTETTSTTNSLALTKKKKVNHNVGHIISLCIEVTHIVNKSKGQLLRDIVDECCSFQGQWDDVVVPKLRQEISYRNTKPIGTVSMRKGRKGGPPTPFTNVESFPNTANGVPIPPTETTSKFFF